MISAAAALLAVTAGAGMAPAAGTAPGAPGSTTHGSNVYGLQSNGSYLTETGQYLTPAGTVITEDGRPMDMALSPDGKVAATLNSGGTVTTGNVALFDLVNHKVLQRIGSGAIADAGITYSPDGTQLWMAELTHLVSYTVNPDGTVSNPVTMTLPNSPTGRAAIPRGMGWSPDGKLLVTESGANRLDAIDPNTHAVVKEVSVGNVPHGVVVVGNNAYVANEGGRPAVAGDHTDKSDGTAIVTQGDDQVPATGTVSEVDLSSFTQVKTFDVGLKPNNEAVQGNDVLVANADSDSVSVIDTATQQVARTFATNPAPGAPYGAQPDNLKFIDPTTLAVSLAGYNTIAMYHYSNAQSEPEFEGLIPSAYYPSGMAWDSQLGKLVVAGEKGLGSIGTGATLKEGVGTTPATGQYGVNYTGTVELIDAPTTNKLHDDTAQVFANNQWNGLLARNSKAQNDNVAPVAIPAKMGQPSTIKHVFLIVRENRTYDQELGDIGRGLSDPSMAQFGQKVTPNAHALVNQFPLVDNFYSDGSDSAEGHQWIDQGLTNNYLMQMATTKVRGAQTDDVMHNNPTGYIWSDAQKAGVTVTNWGEDADCCVPGAGLTKLPTITWQKFYQDSQILEGKASGQLNYPIGALQPISDMPALNKVLQANYPPFDLSIPDQYRADMFQQDFANYVKNDNLPQLNLLWLPQDHTSNTVPGQLSPESMVADNDLALGRIVDTISHSPYWKDSAIFVEEDDSQAGVDHLDGHRNVAMVISPYAKRGGHIDDTYYNQMSMDRTIEQILNIPPMTEADLAAEPMFDSFTNTPDYTPYNAVANQVPLTETNPHPATITNSVQLSWSQWSAKQAYTSEDMVPMAASNRDIWYSNTGWNTPYPGDSKVLLPNEVPGVDAPVGTGQGDR